MSTLSHTRIAVLFVSLLAVLLSAAPVLAAEPTVFRWTDEQGKTHYAERVPEKYQKTAKPLPAGAAGPSEAQQRDALDRAASQKHRAADIEGAASKPRLPAPPSPAASTPPLKRPAQVPDNQTDCPTWARLYQESLDCFGPYRTARGATREEAFAHCTAVDAPPSRCRQRVPDTTDRESR